MYMWTKSQLGQRILARLVPGGSPSASMGATFCLTERSLYFPLFFFLLWLLGGQPGKRRPVLESQVFLLHS